MKNSPGGDIIQMRPPQEADLSPASTAQSILSERYSSGAFSFVSSSRHVVDVLAMQYGAVEANRILSYLGVSRDYLNNIDNPISIRFIEDLLEIYMTRYENSYRNLNCLSRGLFLTVEDTNLRNHFSNTNSYEDAYHQIERSTRLFDRNFEYKFSISSRGFELRTQPSEELRDYARDSRYGSLFLYRYRAHLFGNMPLLCGLEAIPVEVLTCISQGDDICHYKGVFPSKYKALRPFNSRPCVSQV